jgi:hypothetical protein
MRDSQHELFRSQKPSRKTHEGTILLLPGLISENTMRESIVPPLTSEGFNVMLVDHSRRAGPHRCNLERSIDVHKAALSAVEATSDKTVHVIGHSKGGQDAISFMEYAAKNPIKAKYKTYGYGAVAAVGRNGKNPGIYEVIKELSGQSREIWFNVHGERSVLGKSAINLLRNPILAIAEGLTASRADTVQAVDWLKDIGVIKKEIEIYGDSDRLVPAPDDRQVELYEGHHMTSVYRPDVIVDIANRLVS